MSKQPTSAAVKVADFLAAHPGWHTVKEIEAGLDGVARRTITTALKKLTDTDDATVRHAAGPRTASGTATDEVWAGNSTTTPPPGAPDDDETDSPEPHPAPEATPDQTDASTDPEPSGTENSAPSVDDTAADNDDAPSAPEPGSEAVAVPAVAPIPPPNPNVIAVAGILGDHAEAGITAAELSAASGVPEAAVWRILVAADIAGAVISDKSYVLDTAAKWRRSDDGGDIALVQPTDAPDRVDCPCCGQSRRLPGGKGITSGNRGGGARGGVCADGAAPLAPGVLTALVTQWVADNPGTQKRTGEIASAVGARSSGAVLNVLMKLAANGKGVSEVPGVKPQQWRTADPNNQ